MALSDSTGSATTHPIMFRALVYALLGIIVLTVIRMMAGVITKGLSEMLNSNAEQNAHSGPRRDQPSSPAGGELKRDPVCGTFVPASTAFVKQVGGDTIHFCSADCRDKFQPA